LKNQKLIILLEEVSLDIQNHFLWNLVFTKLRKKAEILEVAWIKSLAQRTV